jgi:arginine N-succinyltransferase
MHYEIRAAQRGDHQQLLELAAFLDSVNLPNDAEALEGILQLSEDSFSGKIRDPKRREYMFVLVHAGTQRIIGTSLILAQLGRKEAPYIFLDVGTIEKYSATLDKHFVHRVLTIGYSYSGPTEIGGLVLHPDCRRSPERLGSVISYARFLWIAMRRKDFQNTVVAELLPPLEPDGTSHLWEAIGRHFTDLDYRQADRLSKQNKEFIRSLFPDGDIYVSMLSGKAQAVIGEVGPQSKGVETMLTRVGFKYLERVDPFDGGPHFGCATDEIALVRASRPLRVALQNSSGQARTRMLVAANYESAPYFRAIACQAQTTPDEVTLAADTAEQLGVRPGDRVWCMPTAL